MKHPAEYRGQQVVVLGMARSGVTVAKVFYELGARVTVNDKKERHACPEADPLEAMGISVICGEHPEQLIHADVALVVKNPGIPYTIDPIQKALALGIDVVTEVEVAYFLCPCPMIGITGSNGKTTTTTWVYRMLEAGGMHPILAGNIGRSVCEAVLEAKEENWLVVELSSFQLKGIRHFRPTISCLINVQETHLDYHGSFDDYLESKRRLFDAQRAEDVAVMNWDDLEVRQTADRVNSRVLYFSMREDLDEGVFLSLDEQGHPIIVYRSQGQITEICPVDQLGIPGQHNVENALAAASMAIAAGVSLQTIESVLKQFNGVEHRLEFVAETAGIRFYNDSKATNPSATMKAIESFQAPIILIAGGLDRGSDYMELQNLFKSQIKAIIVLGETKEKLAHVARLAGITDIISISEHLPPEQALQAAVREAYKRAIEGDVVLLSPACASWDMFPSFEERGRIFKESVHNL